MWDIEDRKKKKAQEMALPFGRAMSVDSWRLQWAGSEPEASGGGTIQGLLGSSAGDENRGRKQ